MKKRQAKVDQEQMDKWQTNIDPKSQKKTPKRHRRSDNWPEEGRKWNQQRPKMVSRSPEEGANTISNRKSNQEEHQDDPQTVLGPLGLSAGAPGACTGTHTYVHRHTHTHTMAQIGPRAARSVPRAAPERCVRVCMWACTHRNDPRCRFAQLAGPSWEAEYTYLQGFLMILKIDPRGFNWHWPLYIGPGHPPGDGLVRAVY